MDIPALSINMANAKLSQSIGISVLKNAMDQVEQTGEQIVEMIQSTVPPSGSTIDIKA